MEFYVMVPSESEREGGTLFGPFETRQAALDEQAGIPGLSKVVESPDPRGPKLPACPACGRRYDPQRTGGG